MSESLIEMLKRHEGFRQFPYKCPAGKLTIGYGTNLENRGVSEEEAEYLLLNDLERLTKILRERIPSWHKLSIVRRDVLVDMAYNLGINGLFSFKKMFMYLGMDDYNKAGDEMMHSKWAMQVGKRALELAELMRRG